MCRSFAGGIEASLRRMAHYDYWSDSLRRSILLESGADLVSYGMGERSIVAIADALDAGMPVKTLLIFRELSARCALWMRSVTIRCFLTMKASVKIRKICGELLYSVQQYRSVFWKRLVEPYSQNCFIVQNPASEPLTMEEMDQVYDLPFQRTWHPYAMTQQAAFRHFPK